jgi:hypothetical protein
VTFAWIFFCANSVRDACFVASHLFPPGRLDPLLLKIGGFSHATAPYLVLSIACMFVGEWWIAHPGRAPRLWDRPAFRAPAYNACVYAIAFFGFFGHRAFIYFQL